ncbi:MAG: response regulator [Nitrospinaceae bacterium]|nr:MAG: response regulator [Nitrospinaceae bacterium]
MNQPPKPFSILIAEDDEDDYLLILEALKEAGVNSEVHWVKDGDEVMEFLKSGSNGTNGNNGSTGHLPGLILLDLNMPKKDGREALAEIKSNPKFRKIPVIVMTTSSAETDIAKSYDLGVNSFIQKPVRFDDLVTTAKVLSSYWIGTVKLPN